jgi:deoxyadenosine/deoxycytidine kinase
MGFRVISIDGNIGSGKTTLLNQLKTRFADHPHVLFLDEPVSEWETIQDPADNTNILQKFYNNPAKYSFHFQIIAFITRHSIFTKKQKENCVIISERSLWTDHEVFTKMLLADGQMEPIAYQIYLRMFHEFTQHYTVHSCIYVNTKPEKCSERVHSRERLGEDKISMDYLTNCHTYHEQFINGLPCFVTEIDGNVELTDEVERAQVFTDAENVVIRELNILYGLVA